MSDPQSAPHPHQVPPYASSPGAHQQPSPHQPAPRQPAPQGYVLNGQSAQPAQSTSAPGNPVGRAGLIIGVIAIAISVVTNLLVQVMIRSDGYAIVALISGIGSFFAFAAGITALVLGLIGLRRPGAPHAAAGIATGIGIAEVVGILSNFLVSAVGSLMYF